MASELKSDLVMTTSQRRPHVKLIDNSAVSDNIFRNKYFLEPKVDIGRWARSKCTHSLLVIGADLDLKKVCFW